jgi:serine/threonine protein kinase
MEAGDPRAFGPYEVIGSLGEGGMGRLFLGRGPDGGLVAIKVVRAELAGDEEFRERFRREAVAAMRVPRYCTAEVLAADPDAPEPYLVTEYIDGPTLEEAVRSGGPLRGADLDQLGISVATALVGVHAAGIIHRDLKPANVLLSRVGPRVIDFGVAGAVDATRLTRDGRIIGTPAYMAPEQLQSHPVPASDVFAWGGVMLFAATGRRPFGGTTLPDMAFRIMQEPPDLTGLSGTLLTAVTAAMSKDQAARPTPARLLELLGVNAADDLLRTRTDRPFTPVGVVHAAQAAPVQTEAPSPQGGTTLPEGWQTTWTPPSSSTTRRRRRRRRVSSLLTIVLSLAVIGGAAAWMLFRDRSPDLAVNSVTVRADPSAPGCNAHVDVTATLTTNGAPGQILYQWQRSDQAAPDSPLQQDVEDGRESVTVRLGWDIKGKGTRAFTATLIVLNGPTIQGSSSFRYSCKG